MSFVLSVVAATRGEDTVKAVSAPLLPLLPWPSGGQRRGGGMSRDPSTDEPAGARARVGLQSPHSRHLRRTLIIALPGSWCG